MVAEENILKFLRNFNKDSKVDSRVLKMFMFNHSSKCDVLDMAKDLVKSAVNVENLQFALDEQREQNGMETGAFDDRDCPRGRFDLFSVTSSSHDAAVDSVVENFAYRSDGKLNEEIAKRPKIESQGNVNKYSEEDTNGVVDSLKNSPKECFIPGLEGAMFEEDFNDRLLHTCETENGATPNRIGKQQTGSISKPRISRSTGRVHRNTSEQSLDGQGKDFVFFQNVVSGGTMMFPKPNDPSYLYPVLQCKLCGLRFTKDCTEQFGLHIEDHRRKTKALGDKVVLRREFFSSKSASKMEKLDLEIEGGAESIIWKKEPPYCAICSKIIRKAWSDDAEDWVLDHGIRINDKEFAHRGCVL